MKLFDILTMRQDQQEIEALIKRIFGTEDGKKFLQKLTRLYIETSVGPEVSEAQMRFREGQRSVIHFIFSKLKN